jgi:hypothetical protein
MSIYKITGGNLCYIGSTTESINTRFSKHKNNYKTWKSGGKMGKCSSFEIFDAFGVENCKIELLEQTDTLKDKERFYVESMVCVNKNIPNRTKKEYNELHKEYFTNWNKEYREKTKEKRNTKYICECGGKYTHRNKSVHFGSKKHLTLYPQPQSQNSRPSLS